MTINWKLVWLPTLCIIVGHYAYTGEFGIKYWPLFFVGSIGVVMFLTDLYRS